MEFRIILTIILFLVSVNGKKMAPGDKDSVLDIVHTDSDKFTDKNRIVLFFKDRDDTTTKKYAKMLKKAEINLSFVSGTIDIQCMDISVHKTSFKLQFVPSIGIIADVVKQHKDVKGDMVELEQPFTQSELTIFATTINKNPVNFNFDESAFAFVENL